MTPMIAVEGNVVVITYAFLWYIRRFHSTVAHCACLGTMHFGVLCPLAVFVQVASSFELGTVNYADALSSKRHVIPRQAGDLILLEPSSSDAVGKRGDDDSAGFVLRADGASDGLRRLMRPPPLKRSSLRRHEARVIRPLRFRLKSL